MNKLKRLSLAVVCAGLSYQVQATPTVLQTMGSSAVTYSFFTVKNPPVGVSIPTIQNLLQNNLNASTANTKLTACWVSGDSNVTPINCGNGAMQFGNADMYTYNGASNIPGFSVSKAPLVVSDPKSETLDQVILSSKGTNFVVGTVGVANSGDVVGRVVNIHFNQRVAQFGMLVDGGQLDAPSAKGIQFLVNHQSTSVQSLTNGVPTFVGVEDKAGFTDITIIASGETGTTSESRAWIADQFSFVPMSAF